MPSCLVFTKSGEVIDLKLRIDSPVYYFADITTHQKDAYNVHEFIRRDDQTGEYWVYQIAYDEKPAFGDIEKAIRDLNAEPIEKR